MGGVHQRRWNVTNRREKGSATTYVRQHDDARRLRGGLRGALMMRTRAWMVASLAAGLLLGASAQAQQAPPDYGAPITLDQAKEAAAAAQAEARRNGWRMAVAVVDPGGY